MHVDYVDVFYHHRPDPETPIEETMGALDQIVRSGKALYVGISNYDAEQTREAVRVLKELGTPCLIHQPSYSLLNRRIENNGVLATLRAENVGCICFAPLANGLLTGKYLHGIPADSRAARDPRYLKADNITQEQLQKIARLNEIAIRRGQSLTQMALSWVLRDPGRHLRADRREQAGADSGKCKGHREPDLHRRGAARNRRHPRLTAIRLCGRNAAQPYF